jgi:hypothetical protein
MEKVLINKEEAEALESALEINGGDKANVVAWHAANGLWDGNRAPLNDLDLDDVCRALYVGYEVETDPEEKIVDLYESYPPEGSYRALINEVLSTLNIQIKGINC